MQLDQILNILKDLTTVGLEKFGIYYSTYRGIVVSNEDPDNLNRIKIQVPQIYGDETLDYWVWPKGLYAGKDWGFSIVPRIGDLVWIEFEFGNVRRPLWSFGYRGKNDYVDDFFKDPNVIGLKTKAGHYILLDDSNNLIRIISSGGKTIDIGNKIHLGTAEGKDAEPAVLGDQEKAIWVEIIDILKTGKIMTLMGPQLFMPDTLTKLETLKQKLDNIKSKSITVDK